MLAAAAPASMVLLLLTGGWLQVLALVLAGLASFTSVPVILMLIQKRGFAYPAVANGIYMTMNFALGSVIVLLGGFLSDLVGIENAFRVCTAASALSVPFAFLIGDSQGKLAL